MNIIDYIDNILDKIKTPLYVISIGLIYLSYILVYVGILYVNKNYVHSLNIFIQLFICLFLLFRFNPFREHVLRKNDSMIIFGSALFLLTNLGLTQFIEKYTINKIGIDIVKN